MERLYGLGYRKGKFWCATRVDSNDKIVRGYWGICGSNCNNETVENIVDERIIASSISKINKGSYFLIFFQPLITEKFSDNPNFRV